MRKSLILASVLIALVCSMIPSGFGTYIYSFNYAEVGTGYVGDTLDKSYSRWAVSLTMQITFGTATTVTVAVNKTDSASGDRVEIVLSDGGAFDVWIAGGSSFKLCNTSVSAGWTAGQPIIISYAGNFLTVQRSNGSTVLDDYALGSFPIDETSIKHGTGTLTAGYLTVDIRDNLASGIGTSLIDALVPVMSVSLMLSAIGGMMTFGYVRSRRRRRR